ncbi:MAG: sensor histidine kinase [Bacillota bacterium]
MAGYLAVIFITAFIMAASFYPLMKNYITRVVRENLAQDAESMAILLERVPPDGLVPVREGKRPLYRLAGQFINGECLVVSEEGSVIFSTLESLPAGSRQGKAVARKISGIAGTGYRTVEMGGAEYVAVTRPFKGLSTSGWVVTMARPEGLKIMTRSITLLFLKSLAVSSLAAVLITFLLTRKISGHLSQLRDKAYRVARREYGPGVKINSGDELEDLGEAFNSMEQRIREYDEAQKRFFQNASHELKTPLMSIQGYAEGIRDGTLREAEAGRAVEIIARECQRLKTLVEDLVYMGKLDSPSEIYNFEPVDIEEVMRQALETVGILAREKGIGVRVNMEPVEDLYVRGDGEKLVRVFVNLLGNAVRYAKREITVGGRRSGENLVIRVADDGDGFVQQDINRIWDRFYRGPGGSSGLGLAIVQTVVAAHGGSVTASNNPAGGAVVEVALCLY